MVVCSFFAPFRPRFPLAGLSDSALRLVPAAAAAGLLGVDGAAVELALAAVCRADRLGPAIVENVEG